MSDIVTADTEIYLTFLGDAEKYIATIYSGKIYWFPTVKSNKIKLKLKWGGSELVEGTELQIETQEHRVGSKNLLGAYPGGVYYLSDNDNWKDSRLWQVNAIEPSGDDRKIRYEDPISLTNLYYSPERLIPSGDYLTTANTDDQDYWIIEKV